MLIDVVVGGGKVLSRILMNSLNCIYFSVNDLFSSLNMLLYTHLLVTFIISIQLSHGVKCPCKDASLCKPLTIPTRKESFGFSTGSSSNYKLYDWSKLTTLAVFGKWSDEVLCFAHSKVCVQCLIESILAV